MPNALWLRSLAQQTDHRAVTLTEYLCPHRRSPSQGQPPQQTSPTLRSRLAGGAGTELQLRGPVAGWRHGTARRGMGWNGVGWDGMGWVGMTRVREEWDGM